MKNVVIGGGIVGIFSAYLLKKIFPNQEAIIIEKEEKLGGLLKSKNYEKYGKFDYGIHTFYETGISNIDNFFISESNKIDWNFLCGFRRDLGGSIWNGNFSYNSSYIDLRTLPKYKLEIYKKEILNNLEINNYNDSDTNNALEHLENRFGKSLTNDHLKQLISIRQNYETDLTHKLSIDIQNLSRVIIFELKELLGGKYPKGIEKISAFPNQRNYPKKYLPQKRAFYPKKLGLDDVIEKLVKKLIQKKVKVMRSTEILSLDVNKKKINKIYVSSEKKTINEISVNKIIWSAPIQNLFNLLFPNKSLPKLFRPQKTVIVNMVTSELPNSKGLYWIMSHGHEFIHRVSFPQNYSDTETGYGFKICIECIFNSELHVNKIKEEILKFLLIYKIITDPTKVLIFDYFNSQYGFPNLGLSNITNYKKIRDTINDISIENLINVGLLSEDNLFFQFDLLKNSYHKITRL